METHTLGQQAVCFGALCCTQESGTKLGRFVLSFALSFFLSIVLVTTSGSVCNGKRSGGKQGELKQGKAKSFKLAKRSGLIMDLNL